MSAALLKLPRSAMLDSRTTRQDGSLSKDRKDNTAVGGGSKKGSTHSARQRKYRRKQVN